MPESPERRSAGIRLSVRVRILATLLLVAGLGMVLAGGTAYLVQRERTLRAVDDRLTATVTDAQFVATESAGSTLDAVLTAIIQRLRPGANESSLAIIDGAAALSPGGSVDFRLDGNDALVTRVVRETEQSGVVRGTFAASDGVGTDAAAGQSGDFGTIRYLAAPVSVSTDARTGVFVVAVDLDRELAPLTGAFQTYSLVAAVALLAVAGVGWFVAGRLLRPIRALTGAARRITGADLTERIPVRGNDDVSALTDTVNGMLDRLDGALSGQRRLLDDVGHELKTPLTIVRGHLELMDTADPADVRASRDLAIDEVDRMTSLVAGITLLADSGRAHSLVVQPVEVGALMARVHAKAKVLADRDWAVAAGAETVVLCDPDRLTQAMLQLATNAVTHGAGASGPADAATLAPAATAAPAGAGELIELGSAVDAPAGEVRLWVRDFGPGIPLALQRQIFGRFQRGASAEGRGVSGSGLGLAIVDGIARAHGGRVEIESEPGAGARFTIVLPLAPNPAAGDPAPFPPDSEERA